MLLGPMIHPQLLGCVAAAGHGAGILIADANYPATTKLGRHATVVHLNLRPGLIDAVEVLRSLLTITPIEHATVMATLRDGPYAMHHDPPIWAEFAAALTDAGVSAQLHPLERYDFYAAGSSDDVAVTVVSGESRVYGNLLLRVGVRQ